MNLRFDELKCPVCNSELHSGNTTVGYDVQMVKKCFDCKFWMIIVIPNDDFDYSINRERKLKK